MIARVDIYADILFFFCFFFAHMETHVQIVHGHLKENNNNDK